MLCVSSSMTATAPGLFTWPYLLKLGREQSTVWPAYLDKIAAAGFSRG